MIIAVIFSFTMEQSQGIAFVKEAIIASIGNINSG
jgi:hypothetical protein